MNETHEIKIAKLEARVENLEKSSHTDRKQLMENREKTSELVGIISELADLKHDFRAYTRKADEKDSALQSSIHELEKKFIEKITRFGVYFVIASAVGLILLTAIINSAVGKIADRLSAPQTITAPR